MATVSLPLRSGKPQPIAPTRAEIARYLALEERRLELNRQARAIEAEADQLAGSFREYVAYTTNGKRSKVVACAGYMLSLVAGRVCPAWKKEFIARLGEGEAERVIENTPATLVLSIAAAVRATRTEPCSRNGRSQRAKKILYPR